MFDPDKFIEDAVSSIKEKAKGKAIIACSGGIDSSVSAVLAGKALGKDLLAIFVDTGFMRKNEPKEVENMFKDTGINFKSVDASNEYFEALEGITDPEKKLEALKGFTGYFKKTYGSLEFPYGDLYRIKIGEHDIPANGGIGSFGVFRTLDFRSGPDRKNYAISGDGYVCAIEFGKEPIAKVIMTYGNASQKDSKHVGDQLDLFAKKEMRNALLKRKDVEANLEERETIK